MKNSILIRKATVTDTELILFLIKELAQFEKLSHEVVATKELLKGTLFSAGSNVTVFIAEENNAPVGFALTFFNYSTFLGAKGLYLEDLYIMPQHRSKGFGTQMLKFLARFALEQNCGRFEWSVLNWNKKAIELYEKLGAQPLKEWTVYRMDRTAIAKLDQ